MRLVAKRLLAGAALALAATGVSGPTALAAPHVGSDISSTATTADPAALLAYVKAKAAAAISLRESALQAAVLAVGSNLSLAPADRASLQSISNGQAAALATLATTIQADPTVVQADADYTAIFLNFRVFVLVLPQVRLAASADDLTATVIPRLTDAQGRLEALLSGFDSAKDSAAVQAARSDLAKQISVMTTATSGVATQVLGYHPGDWNGNHAILDAPIAALVRARAAATAARGDIKAIVTALS